MLECSDEFKPSFDGLIKSKKAFKSRAVADNTSAFVLHEARFKELAFIHTGKDGNIFLTCA